MAKAKKNKKANADRVYEKKTNAAAKSNPFADAAAASKKLNPFEVHVNREKFQILGRTCKHDKGLPGVSRAKAVKKRKETLAQEFEAKHKTNQFRDRRIGKHLTAEQLNDDVLNARFLAEKMAQMKQGKASRFNLNDDEILTHRGQTLEEIEQFRDERSDSEEDDDAKLDADFTEVAHFGGDTAQSKDRQTAIEEMILEQKRRKIEIAKEKDEVHNLTEKLDSNYKELLGLMGKMSKSEMLAKPKPDDYDKALREMIFEPRGVVTDKLLSDEELAKREKERLEQLEKERLKRMQGDGESLEEAEQPKHRSADALDDGYFAYGDEEEEGTLAYNLDGELATKISENGNKNTDGSGSNADNSDSESGEEEATGDVESSEEGEDVENKEESSDSSEEEEDNFSDLKESDSESETEAENEKKQKNESEKCDVQPGVEAVKTHATADKTKEMKLVESTELPFTIDMPDSYEGFNMLLNKHTPDEQAIIVERLIKCNHPKLDGVNREKVVKLFAFLLQHINERFSSATQDDIALQFQILNKLNPYMYDLLHLNPERMSTILLTVIKEKYTEYRKNSKSFPPLETIIFFKLVSNYFSTSDFRHPVVTPSYIFIQHILSKARVRTREDVAGGLFLVTLVLEFSRQSKRFLPAALNFLLGIIFLSIPKRPIEVLKIVSPFQSTGPMSKLLTIAETAEIATLPEELLQSKDLVLTTFSADFKVRALNTALKLVKDAIETVEENVGANYLALPFLEMLDRLPLDIYPEYVRQNCEAAKQALERVAAKKLTKIVPPEKKPKALRLLEPRIETIYDDKRRPRLSKEKEEKVKLLHKLKRETKGAVREIRRDTEFLQKMRIQQQIRSDMERKEKVKRIFQEASVQQSELNELARLKKRKKF